MDALESNLYSSNFTVLDTKGYCTGSEALAERAEEACMNTIKHTAKNATDSNLVSIHAIVADIGGTNARFSRVNLNTLTVDKTEVYTCKHFPDLLTVIDYYRNTHGLQGIKQVVLAIACPVLSDVVRMTNLEWEFSISELKKQLNLNHLQVVNDFLATAMSLAVLTPDEKIQIGQGQADLTKPMVVLGAGTGLGVAHLIPLGTQLVPLPGEGGHQNFAPHTEQEWFIHQFLNRQFGHVSIERLLSGPGLISIYQALASYQGQLVTPLSASEIVHLALNQQSKLAEATVEQFLTSLGCYAGDLALTLSTFGGVYIAGGIVPRLLPLLNRSQFRARFEAKGRFSTFNSQIPTYVITAEQPGLVGAAVYLKQGILS